MHTIPTLATATWNGCILGSALLKEQTNRDAGVTPIPLSSPCVSAGHKANRR